MGYNVLLNINGVYLHHDNCFVQIYIIHYTMKYLHEIPLKVTHPTKHD